jgi:hypothetical protein
VQNPGEIRGPAGVPPPLCGGDCPEHCHRPQQGREQVVRVLVALFCPHYFGINLSFKSSYRVSIGL